MPSSDCDQDYAGCKSKCFEVLVENLSLAGDDAEKIADAKEKYKKCRSLCKAAKTICDEAGD
jgi:hypothetical protein